MTQNLFKSPLFLVPLSCKNDDTIRRLENGLTILDENDEVIRKAYEDSACPPPEINLGKYRLITYYSPMRPGLKVVDEDGREILSLSFMIQLGKTDKCLPDYAAYQRYSDLGRAFLASLKNESFIEPSSTQWKDAISIIGQKFAPAKYSKVTYVGHFEADGDVPARTAQICHFSDSAILSRENLPNHRPLYSIIHPDDYAANFIIASSVTHVPGSHKLQNSLDNMYAAQTVGRLEGLAE